MRTPKEKKSYVEVICRMVYQGEVNEVAIKKPGADHTVSDMLEIFESVLRGAGYAVDMDSLQVAEDEHENNG